MKANEISFPSKGQTVRKPNGEGKRAIKNKKLSKISETSGKWRKIRAKKFQNGEAWAKSHDIFMMYAESIGKPIHV